MWEEGRGVDALWLVEFVDEWLHALASANDDFSGGGGIGHVFQFAPRSRKPADGHGGFGLAVLAEEGWVADYVVDGTL